MKDSKNKQLRERLFNGELKPFDLVRMSADELANSELVSWREQEKQRILKDTIRIADLSALPVESELRNFIPSAYREAESKEPGSVSLSPSCTLPSDFLISPSF